MEKFKKVFLVLCLLLTGIVLKEKRINANTNILVNKIEIKYEYPTIEELNKLETMDEKYKASNLDVAILKQLNDDELIDAVINYPYLLDIYAYDNFEVGVNYVKDHFNGIDELLERNITMTTTYDIGSLPLRNKTVNAIITAENNYVRSSTACPTNYDGYIKTPNNTSVGYCLYGERITSDEIEEFKDYIATNYSSATLLRDPTTNYNCHSYAWYSTSASNTKWIPYATAYMSDGSYTQRSNSGNLYAGDKVYYSKSGYEHSGIVYNNSSLNYNNVWVTSKWGKMGLVRHLINNCPYYVGSNYSYVSFWY